MADLSGSVDHPAHDPLATERPSSGSLSYAGLPDSSSSSDTSSTSVIASSKSRGASASSPSGREPGGSDHLGSSGAYRSSCETPSFRTITSPSHDIHELGEGERVRGGWFRGGASSTSKNSTSPASVNRPDVDLLEQVRSCASAITPGALAEREDSVSKGAVPRDPIPSTRLAARRTVRRARRTADFCGARRLRPGVPCRCA